jgi:hypothetical protein
MFIIFFLFVLLECCYHLLCDFNKKKIPKGINDQNISFHSDLSVCCYTGKQGNIMGK